MPLELQLTPINRISPSVFYAFKKCALYGTLSMLRVPKMLPSPPNSYVGSIIHEIIKMVREGKIDGRNEFESTWSELVSVKEEIMAKSLIEKHLIPLREHSSEYEVKKLLCKKFINKLCSEKHIIGNLTPSGRASHLNMNEIWLQSSDGKVGGYLDAIIPTEGGDIIVDYKSGQYLEDFSQESSIKVKEEYVTQLKLYSSLYHAHYGKWPVSLKIVGIDGNCVDIDFTFEECEEMLREAVELLNHTNSIILKQSINNSQKLQELSSPSMENCKFCQFRPFCKGYLESTCKEITKAKIRLNDFCGTILDCRTLGNGKLFIKISLESKSSEVISIRNLSIERHPALDKIGNSVVIFSLLAESGDKMYHEGPLTTSFRKH